MSFKQNPMVETMVETVLLRYGQLDHAYKQTHNMDAKQNIIIMIKIQHGRNSKITAIKQMKTLNIRYILKTNIYTKTRFFSVNTIIDAMLKLGKINLVVTDLYN